VGDAIARLAVKEGLDPIVAGRDAYKIAAQAAELGVDCRVFSLDDTLAIDQALEDVDVVLHCAGPFIHTYEPMATSCLRTGTHYLDITGEIPVYQALAALNAKAKVSRVMLLPGVGFDVVATDCLAAHLKQRLPTATHLTLAFHSDGPAGLPPGTTKTMIEMFPYGRRVRRNGRFEDVPREIKKRMIDFGSGPVEATCLSWGDVFMAFYSTGIPNIEDYAVLPEKVSRPRAGSANQMPASSTPELRARTRTHVWGQVQDDQGHQATSRLHGPEAGVDWTALAALGAVKKVLAGEVQPGFQTPSQAFGSEFVMENKGVTREDLG
jgi:short subunit dehydrogenase-like uncharacterized protein